ncbi:uncharacterized mitochondrial protein-like protein, partial [Tanacetum coccineum]
NEMCTEFEKMMNKKFQMSSMGELMFFLGLQVTQKDDGIFISQDKYVDEILKKFGFSTVKTTSTLMETSKPLMKDDNAEDVDVYLYRSEIGLLVYLTSSRPDIMFAICACARFQVTPKVLHLHVVKKIFKYLKGQPKLGLWYPKDSPFDLEDYTDSDYAGVSLDRKSTIRGCQFLGSRLISWQCKKQTVVANSTTKAEYVVASSCCGQVMAILVISVSSDSLKDSVGTPTGRVILFGTIPTTIPDTIPVINPPTTQTDTTVIPTYIPIISPTIPPSLDYTPTSPDYSPTSDMEFDPSKDPSSDHIPPLPTISPFLSSVDDTTDSDTPDTPPSPTYGTPFTKTTFYTQMSPTISGALRRRVMILAPGQPIPHGRPYRYYLNGPVHMMTVRKRVGPLPTHTNIAKI